ncbi:MAG: zinc-binding dehydrogenase [Actinomycetota bacterium]
MRAAILRNGRMVVDDIADLSPGPGQVLVETVACGICGSDLHTVDHGSALADAARDAGSATFDYDPEVDLVMGHEMSVRVLDTGAGVDGVAPGLVAAAMPTVVTPDGGMAVPGYSNVYPGGYSEQMLLAPWALVPVPNGLDPAHAALTEPMAVGLHAVNESTAAPGRAALVAGAGPVGLAIIAALAVAGVEPIIASDFSPRRRELALTMGAHVAVDPSVAPDRASAFAPVVDAWQANGALGPPVIFEAVGVPGMVESIMATAPAHSEIVVAGVCMEPDHFRPIMGIMKHLSLRFVLGWSPDEFAASLRNLAEGRIDPNPLVTGQVRLEDVPAAFATLADPEDHVKILVRPNGEH